MPIKKKVEELNIENIAKNKKTLFLRLKKWVFKKKEKDEFEDFEKMMFSLVLAQGLILLRLIDLFEKANRKR